MLRTADIARIAHTSIVYTETELSSKARQGRLEACRQAAGRQRRSSVFHRHHHF